MQSLQIDKKIDRDGFMLAADTRYFTDWSKTLYHSIRKHAPWAHVHFHLFDPTDQDLAWLASHDCSYTCESTPENYCQDHTTKVLYWAAVRYIRVTDIYQDHTRVINLDVDSIMVNDLSYDQFVKDLSHTWVPVAKKRETLSLCSAIGFAPDQGRYHVRNKLETVYKNSRLTWALDQRLCDELLDEGKIQPQDLRYTNFKFDPAAVIWTGKGDRVFKKTFQDKLEFYRGLA